jgi:hypothetical protein
MQEVLVLTGKIYLIAWIISFFVAILITVIHAVLGRFEHTEGEE